MSSKHIFKDQSKEKIADLKALSKQFDLEHHSGNRRSGVKLPKIRSMSINTSYKYLNKNKSMVPGAAGAAAEG